MVAVLASMLWNSPSITRQVIESMSEQWALLQSSISTGDPAGITLAVLSLILLPLPLLGLVFLVGGILRRLVAVAVPALRRRRPRPQPVGATSQEITMSGSDPAAHSSGAVVSPPAPHASATTSIEAPAGAGSLGPRSVSPVPVVPDPLPPPAHTAAELTERFLLRAQPHIPRGGWRRGVFSMTGGHLNPGPSRRERR